MICGVRLLFGCCGQRAACQRLRSLSLSSRVKQQRGHSELLKLVPGEDGISVPEVRQKTKRCLIKIRLL